MIKGALTAFTDGECITEFTCDTCGISSTITKKTFAQGRTEAKKQGFTIKKDDTVICKWCKGKGK